MIDIKVVKFRDYDIQEDRVAILIERNNRRHEGALFFEADGHTRVCKTLETIQISEDNRDERSIMLDVFKTYLDFCDAYGVKYFKTTLSSMMHWSYMNNFTNYSFGLLNVDEFNDIAYSISRPDQVGGRN